MPTLWHSQALIFFLCLCSALFTSCGGSSSNPPPPAQDFTLSVSTAEIVTTAGTVSPPFSVSITGKNGFRDSASVTLSGLPSGATSQPASPFTVGAGQSQAVTISVPASLGLGSFTVQVDATSGSVSHQDQVILVLMVIKTSHTGTMLELETDTLSETTRVGLLKEWGGSIIEISLNGTDYVNNDDPGRQIQTSLWDGNANYITSWGYNPIEAGDHFFHGSPLLANTLMPESIYTKTQPIQWAPENFGGGTDSVLGDAYIEKWISVVPSYNRVFKVHYRITHFGTDSHAQNLQELPVAYVNPNTPHFLYYGGTNPWTNGALTPFDVQGPCCDHVHTPEKWGAYVASANIPTNGDTLRGNASVGGWAWSLSPVASIIVLLDGSQVASATLGISRPDVTSVFPDAPPDTGFEASLDTTKFSNGTHSLIVKGTNVNGAVTILPTVQVAISN